MQNLHVKMSHPARKAIQNPPVTNRSEAAHVDDSYRFEVNKCVPEGNKNRTRDGARAFKESPHIVRVFQSAISLIGQIHTMPWLGSKIA